MATLSPLQLTTLRSISPKARGFKAWLKETLDEPAEVRDVESNEELRLDYLGDYLREEFEIRVREDGIVGFEEATTEVRRLLNGLDVAVYHHTADGVWESIRDRGLMPTNKDCSRHGAESLGVYVTSLEGGAAVDCYSNRAQVVHGGAPIAITIRARFEELAADTNDNDVSAGRYQFVLPSVQPNQILSINGVSLAEFKPADTPPVREGEVRLFRGETDDPNAPKNRPSWMDDIDEVKESIAAAGRWFNPTAELALYYNTKFGMGDGRITFVDVPEGEVERYRVSNLGPEVKKHSSPGCRDQEFFLPKQYADMRRPLRGFVPPEVKSESPGIKGDDAKTKLSNTELLEQLERELTKPVRRRRKASPQVFGP